MSAPVLRSYQSDVVDRIWAAIAAGCRAPLIVAPTGAGKTVIAAEIVRREIGAGRRALFLAHRRELIAQASEKLHALGILDQGIILAGHPTRPAAPVQIASISTLHARAVRSTKMDLPPADLVLVDEAHHIRAASYRAIVAEYPEAVIIGLTATPCRGDGRGLGNSFDRIIECPGVAELIELGYLVPTRVFAPSRPDLSGVKVARGDYVEAQLAERMDRAELVGDIVEHWLRLAERRRTVVFATTVAHSVHLRDQFRAAGVWAEHIDGGTPADERDGILAKLRAGSVEVVCNCAVLCEGWDQPEVACLVLARPTRSTALFRQMVGRALRPAPGKVDALVLDHAGAVFEHGFIDDPIRWTLQEDRRAENPRQAARMAHKAPALATCPECHAVRLGGQACSNCGWRPQARAEVVAVRDGDLAPVDRNRKVGLADWTPEEKHSFFRQLIWIARERNYRAGWASHKYRERFGVWPAAGAPAIPSAPTDATRSWVRSRQIAYAKGAAARGAA